ncbi:hypothetical protein EI94DRAFT_421874 [Lactarius quietus]|nr:hypothetical protein EI94DRAFT_421874 [Lactarius quietus]
MRPTRNVFRRRLSFRRFALTGRPQPFSRGLPPLTLVPVCSPPYLLVIATNLPLAVCTLGRRCVRPVVGIDIAWPSYQPHLVPFSHASYAKLLHRRLKAIAVPGQLLYTDTISGTHTHRGGGIGSIILSGYSLRGTGIIVAFSSLAAGVWLHSPIVVRVCHTI